MFKLLARLDRWGVSPAVAVWVVTVVICLSSIVVMAATRASVAADSRGVYPVRNQLLLEALNHVGACDQESAALVWAEGLKLRNGAMQYSAMNSALKKEYAAQLEETFPNWVTGVSSPWIERYEVLRITPLGESQADIALKFTTATSTGIAGSYFATLTAEREDGFWRISKIDAQDALNVYTGFK